MNMNRSPEHVRLHADLRLFEAIVEQTPDAIIFADCDGMIRVWNRGAETVFGFSAAEVIGSSLDVIIPERFRLGHTLYVDLSFGLVTSGAGSVIGSVAVGGDCSARYLSEKALRERLAELERKVS